jgi:hypothetical protein
VRRPIGALREIAAYTCEKTLTMSVFDENRNVVHRTQLEMIHETGADC